MSASSSRCVGATAVRPCLTAALCLLASFPALGLEQPAPLAPYLDGVFPDRDPTAGGPQPPALLSATGAFTNLTVLTPHPGLLPYKVNAPLWSDAAIKSRWIAVPHDGTRDAIHEKITFSPETSWDFPAGTVLVKHFELNTDENDPAQVRRLETRFLVITSGDFYGVTYRWRPNGADADLLPDSASDPITIQEAGGGSRVQTWDYPGRADCRTCHNPSIGTVLGPRTHQLNGDLLYPGQSTAENQLEAWNSIGLFTPAFSPGASATFLKSHHLSESGAPVAERVRSYLDSNCANCHHPGHLSTSFDLRYTTPLESQNIVNGSLLYDLGVPGARVVAPQDLPRSIMHTRMSTTGIHRMPPIGRSLTDAAAVSALEEWILSLSLAPPPSGNSSPAAADDEGLTIAGVPTDIPAFSNDRDADGDSLTLYASTQPAHGTVSWSPSGIATYTPPPGFTGVDTFTYTLADSQGGISNPATVTVIVSPAASANSVTFLDRSSLLANPSARSGVAMAVADMNRDGLDDIVHFDDAEFLAIDYQQPGGAPFTSLALGGFDDYSMWGLAVGDADNNGYPDLITGGYYDGLHYFRANSSGSAYSRTDLNSPAIFLQAVNFADINGDGWLDVFACHDDAESAKFRNLGNGTLIPDAGLIDTATVPASDNSGNYGTVWTDYDGDGDPDLYMAKCRQGVSSSSDPRRINQLFRNNGNGTYTEVAAPAGLADGRQSWAADFGDIDNDGDLDCFIGNHMAASRLLRNDGSGAFTDITAAAGISIGWDVIQNVFRDFNNDGWLDLLATGEQHQLWLNDGDGTFTLAPNPFSSSQIESCAVGDLNRDGFPDLFAGYADFYNSPNRVDRLFLSSPNSNGFLSLTLEGRQSNKLASGARLELTGPWGTQVREVRSGEGYGITHSFTQIFGLGNRPVAPQLIVRWPSGVVDLAQNLAANQFLLLKEGSTAPPVLAGPGPQSTPTGTPISLQIIATDPTDDPLTWTAVNLPPGLTIDPASGLITGTAPFSPNAYTVTISASDGWSEAQVTFNWSITSGDSDHDGLPTDWEIAHGLDPFDPADALLDQDRDGLLAIAEWALGHDPQSMEVAELILLNTPGTGDQIQPVVAYTRRTGETAGVSLTLQRAANPAGPWLPLTGPTSSTPSGPRTLVEVQDSITFPLDGLAGPQQAFYRLSLSGQSNGIPWSDSTPVSSYLRFRCPQDADTRLGLPVRRRAEARAQLSSASVSGSTLSLTAQGSPNWNAGLFNDTHWLRFEDGNLAGQTYRIRASGNSSLELDLPAGEPVALPVAGDRFTIFPTWTLDSLFEDAGTVFFNSDDLLGFNRGTEVLLFDQREAGIHRSADRVVFRLLDGMWRSTANPTDEENGFVLDPDSHLAVRCSGPRATWDAVLTIAGTIEPTVSATLLTGDEAKRDTLVGLQSPAPVRLADLGLMSSGAFAGSPNSSPSTRKDELLVHAAPASTLNPPPSAVYFYDLGTTRWRNAATPGANANFTQIPAGAALTIRKAPTSSPAAWWRFIAGDYP